MSDSGGTKKTISYCDAAKGITEPAADDEIPDSEEQQEEPQVVVKEIDDETGEETVLIEEALAEFMGRKTEPDDAAAADQEDGNEEDLEIVIEDLWVPLDDPHLKAFALANSVPRAYFVALINDGKDVDISTNDTKFDNGTDKVPRWRKRAPKLASTLVTFIKSLKDADKITHETPLSMERSVMAKLIGNSNRAEQLLTSDEDIFEAWVKSQSKRDEQGNIGVAKIVYEFFIEHNELPNLIAYDENLVAYAVPNDKAKEMMGESNKAGGVEPQYTYLGMDDGTTAATSRNGVVEQLGEKYWSDMELVLKAMTPAADTSSSTPPSTSKAAKRRRRRKKGTPIPAAATTEAPEDHDEEPEKTQ